jgi:hypothetical protein
LEFKISTIINDLDYTSSDVYDSVKFFKKEINSLLISNIIDIKILIEYFIQEYKNKQEIVIKDKEAILKNIVRKKEELINLSSKKEENLDIKVKLLKRKI